MPDRILVVDDMPDACELLGRLLRRCGYEVATACDGADALARLEGFAPDLVILDLHMPVLDGYGFLERVRKLPRWSGLHVIVFTADYESDQERLDALGVTRVCRKAYTPFQTLIEHVGDCLSC